MGATLQTDHAAVAQATLPAQFRDSTRLLALVEAIVGQAALPTWGLQELERVLFDVRDERWLATAVGEQLDQLGAILGLHRTSATDSIYRDALRAQVAINTSQGDPPTLIRLLFDLTDPDAVHLTQNGEAFFAICAINATRDDEIARFSGALSAGVAHIITVGESAHPFILGRAVDAAGALDTIFDPHPSGLSFGTVGAGDGGLWTSVRHQVGD